MSSSSTRLPLLAVRAGAHACAFPLPTVDEVMRPLPVSTLPTRHAFVRGATVIRGSAVPVIDLERLLDGGAPEKPFGRLVVLKNGPRRLAAGVTAVHGVLWVDRDVVATLPGLLEQGDTGILRGLEVRDRDLLLLLEPGRQLHDLAAEVTRAGGTA